LRALIYPPEFLKILDQMVTVVSLALLLQVRLAVAI
jgi:hypothetical protein